VEEEVAAAAGGGANKQGQNVTVSLWLLIIGLS
jgi:hypothetical protein